MGTQHTCDCSAEACAGGADACSAQGELFLWNSECETCQCPFDYVPTCKPKQEPEPAPEPSAAPTFSSTAFPTTFVPTEETAMGCYVSQSVRDAGYQLGACDCEMTEAECNAEPKTEQGQFPIWSDECKDICLCTTGTGCYQLAPEPAETQHTCDCSPDICDGGRAACLAKGVANLWSDECTSCQCPLLPTIPTECKARSVEPEPEPEPGCYVSQSVRDAGYENGACDCTMTEAECDAEPKTEDGQFPIWTGGCEDICLCTTGTGCYQLASEPAETQHTCDCSPEICDGGRAACLAKGVGNLWSDECPSCQCPLLPTIPTQCKAKSAIGRS